MTVRREWYPVPRGTPSIGFPTAFGSARWEAFPWLPRNVGEVYPSPIEYTQKPTPSDMPFDHFCGTEADFQLGAIFNADLPPVKYDADGIPKCCGRPNMCICTQEEIVASGTTQAAAPEISGSNVVWASQSTTRGLRLPAREGAVIWMWDGGAVVLSTTCKLYPPVGERFGQLGTENGPIVIGPGTLYQGQIVAVRYVDGVGVGYWRLVPMLNPTSNGFVAQAVLGASFTITGTSGTYQNTGLSVSLPLPGTWRISGQIQGTVNPAAAGAHTVDVRLRDQTGGVVLTDSESRICRSDTAGVPSNLTGALEAFYTANIPSVIELQAARTGTAWTNAQIVSASTGKSKLVATRVWGFERTTT